MINKNGKNVVICKDVKTDEVNQHQINWSVFDHIYCIHYLPFSDRLNDCKSSLSRLGILQQKHFSFEYTVPNKYYDVLLDSNRYDSSIDRCHISQRNLNLQINRLNLMKKAYFLGYARILILEDDLAFHKDISLVADYINNIPKDYDIVNFDYWFLNKQELFKLLNDKLKEINTWYVDSGSVQNMWNMSFVSISRRGMKYLIDSQEKMLRPMDNYIAYKSKNYELAKDIKFAVSKTNLSIQKLYNDRQNYRLTDKYDGQGLDYNNYIGIHSMDKTTSKTVSNMTTDDAISQAKENTHISIDQKELLDIISPASKKNSTVKRHFSQLQVKVALCTIARQENAYIREFVEYYYKFGIDKIFLYDTNLPNDEKFEDVLQDFIDNGFVEVVPFQNKQITQEVLDAYADCYNAHKDEYDWFCFFDPDEYLKLIEHRNIKEFLVQPKYADFDIVHINWKVYDDNDLLENDGRPLNVRFTRPCEPQCEISENMRIKSIVRGGLDNIVFLNPHTPYDKETLHRVCNPSGQQKPNTFVNTIDFNIAYLKHFRCKTITEYVENKIPKLMLSGYKNLCFDDSFFFALNKWTQEKQDIYDKLISRYLVKDYCQICSKRYKYSVLTVLTGTDQKMILRTPRIVDPDVEYVCVTDRMDLKSNVWKIVQLKKPIYSPAAKWKYPKFHPFEFVHSDICLYIDASIQIETSVDSLIDAFNESKCELGLMLHPDRGNIYDELDRWVEFRGYPRDVADNILQFYKDGNYESKSLYFCSMMLMKNTLRVSEFGKEVWKLLNTFNYNTDVSHSDQIFVPFAVDGVFSNTKFQDVLMINPSIMHSILFSRYNLENKKVGVKNNALYAVDNKLVKPFAI